MDVYQCPGCELRYVTGAELLDHIATDHPAFEVKSKSAEDALLSAAHRHRHATHYQAGSEKNAP